MKRERRKDSITNTEAVSGLFISWSALTRRREKGIGGKEKDS